MKASLLKKLNLIIEEGNTLKDKNKFEEAVKKFQEALNFIEDKVKAPEDKTTEIENIRNTINQTYSVQIDNIVTHGIHLTSQKKFDKAKEEFHNALQVCDLIDDIELKNAEVDEINKLISENDIEKLMQKGLELKSQNNQDGAIEIFKEAFSIAEDIYGSDHRSEALSRIKKEITIIYDSQIDKIVEKGKNYKENGQIEEAIKTFESAIQTIETFFDPNEKKTQITSIKNLTNELYSNQIQPLIENGKDLLSQNLKEQAISKLQNAVSLINKMYDSNLKNLKNSLIAEVLNPIYIQQINPLIEKGIGITKQERFEESINAINDAVEIFHQCLDIVNNMVLSEEKEAKVNEIKELINNVCTSGINVIKNNSIQFIVQKKYDEAISDLYIALSLAKRMVYPEEENPELENLKNLVNKVYSAEVAEVVSKGNHFVEQKEYEEAIKTYNDALTMTNKMYLTYEMEKEVALIKSLIYETEVKLLVGKGELAEEQKLKEKEIEKLKN